MPSIYPIKNLSSGIAVILLTTSLAACGGDGSDSQSSSNSKPTTPNPSDECKDAKASNSTKPDLDQDGIIDDCDTDIDGDGIINSQDAKPLDATIAGISTKSYKGNGFGYVNATKHFYFDAKKQLIKSEYLSSSNPERANLSEQFTYDDKGRLIRREQTRGIDEQIDRIEVWVYNQKNQLIEYNVNADSDNIFEKTKIYQYNSNGDIAKIIESDTSSTSNFDNLSKEYTYNTLNQIEQIKTDEANDGIVDRITDLTYDANNYLSQSMLYFIDRDNNNGNDIKNLYRTLRYTYNSKGNVLTTAYDFTGTGDQSTTYVYDNQENIIRKIINYSGGSISVIDTEVTYGKTNLATGAKTTYDSRNNLQNVTDVAEYNSDGYLTRTLMDVSQNGKINQEITYSYQGGVPIKFNTAPFLDLGESSNRMPTATNILNSINVGYTADTAKDFCYGELNIYTC